MLAQLGEVDAPESNAAFAERLSHWLGWTDAISLSGALNGHAPPAAAARKPAAGTVEAEAARVRKTLSGALLADRIDPQTEFSTLRRRYAARQQAMESGIGALRARVREAVAARSPGLARLAAVDAVMEQALGEREQHLLSTVPALLEPHFTRLRDTQAPEAPQAWLDVFCKDMQAVLLAELDVRMQPVEGLLEALRQ